MITVLDTQFYEDDNYTYEKQRLSDGGININKRPKYPAVPKDKLLNESFAPMLAEAWRNMIRDKVQKSESDTRSEYN